MLWSQPLLPSLACRFGSFLLLLAFLFINESGILRRIVEGWYQHFHFFLRFSPFSMFSIQSDGNPLASL